MPFAPTSRRPKPPVIQDGGPVTYASRAERKPSMVKVCWPRAFIAAARISPQSITRWGDSSKSSPRHEIRRAVCGGPATRSTTSSEPVACLGRDHRATGNQTDPDAARVGMVSFHLDQFEAIAAVFVRLVEPGHGHGVAVLAA